MLLEKIKIDLNKFEQQISAIDVKLNTLNRIREDYKALIAKMRDNIASEESDAYSKLEQRANQQIVMLTTEINSALAARQTLSNVLEKAKENGTLVGSILDNSINTIKNTVETTAEAAKAAATAAGAAGTVAAVL